MVFVHWGRFFGHEGTTMQKPCGCTWLGEHQSSAAHRRKLILELVASASCNNRKGNALSLKTQRYSTRKHCTAADPVDMRHQGQAWLWNPFLHHWGLIFMLCDTSIWRRLFIHNISKFSYSHTHTHTHIHIYTHTDGRVQYLATPWHAAWRSWETNLWLSD